LGGGQPKSDRASTTVRRENEEDRPYYRHTTMILDRESRYARIAWTSSEVVVGSLSSSEADSDGGVIGLAISLPLCLVVA
ncbi:hypothetical protein Tco_0342790, partial [Tanacetum coccineum]